MGADAPRVLLGHIAGAHGVRGDVLIRSHTSSPEDIAAYGPLADETGRRRFDITVVRVTAKGIVARVAGIDDRTAAEQLKGTRLYVDRQRLPAAGEDEYYHSDLIGLQAMSPDNCPIGEVIAVHNYGAGDILEIRLAGSRGVEMVPFTQAFVPAVDLSAGVVTVALPQGDEDLT